MSRHHRDYRLRSRRGRGRDPRHPRLEPDASTGADRLQPLTLRPSPWPLHRLLDMGNRRLFSTSTAEVVAPQAPTSGEQTRALVAYGVKVGLGKAAQEAALSRLQRRFPAHAALLSDPVVRAGLKLALPLVGIQLAGQLRDPRLSARIRDASQGMLLANTIDLTADVAGHLAEQAAGLGRTLLGLYGIDDATDAAEGAAQIVRRLGMDPASALPASLKVIEEEA